MARVPLTTEQYRRLVGLLAATSALTTSLRREALLAEVGLGALAPRLTLDTDARTFASQLVRVLQERGTLAATGQPALLSLLHWLREEVAGHEEEAAFVDTLLAPHTLAAEPDGPSAPPLPPAPVPSQRLRALLIAAFSDSELTTFCYDHFRAVYEEFAGGMTRGDKVQRLIEHCDQRGETAQLLALVRQANPYQYKRLIEAGD